MDYHLPFDTQIISYASREGRTGIPYEASLSFDFKKEDILETLSLQLLPDENSKQYFRLSLGDNPSPFDSYLVLEANLVIKK